MGVAVVFCGTHEPHQAIRDVPHKNSEGRVRSARLKRGQEFQIIVKGGIVHLVPVKSLEEMRGFAPSLTTEGLRDKSDRV